MFFLWLHHAVACRCIVSFTANLYLNMVLISANFARAVALVEDGRNYGYVAIVLNISRSTIERVQWRNISQVTTRDVYLSENVVGSY